MNPPVALTAADAEKIGTMKPGMNVLKLPWGKVPVELGPDTVRIGGHLLPRSELSLAKRGNVLYAPVEGHLVKLQVYHGRLYKLAPTGGWPALEIDGIRMHRTKGILPEEEAELKANSLDIMSGQKVLDICTGLGYSAQAAARRGAWVLTLEREWDVLEMASMNPCSAELFESLGSGGVSAVVCDASRYIACLPNGLFDRIMHDPPTLSMAGELYSLEFYRELRRVLKDDGVLLHYTGQPGSRYRRRDLKSGVAKRLGRAGFRTSWVEKARCLLAAPIVGIG
jgi:predicted methyltransferase